MLPILFKKNYLAFWAQSVDILAHIATPDCPQYKNISAPFAFKITVSVEHPRPGISIQCTLHALFINSMLRVVHSCLNGTAVHNVGTSIVAVET